MVNTGRAIDGVVGAFLGLSWIAVALRIYVRGFMLKRLQPSDYLIILTLISGTCEAAFIFIGTRGGIGNSNFEPTPENISKALKNQLIIELFFSVSITFLRISIGLQLWALVKIQELSSQRKLYSNIQRWTIIFIVGIMVIFGIPWFFTLLFQCTPVSFFWTRIIGATDGTCLSNDVQAGMGYTQAGLSAFSDFALGLLPIWILWSVNMPRRSKFTVAGLLGIGISAGVVALVRLVYTKHLIFDSKDFFGDPVPIIICAYLELSLGILATCISTLRPLFLKFAGKLQSHRDSNNEKTDVFRSKDGQTNGTLEHTHSEHVGSSTKHSTEV